MGQRQTCSFSWSRVINYWKRPGSVSPSCTASCFKVQRLLGQLGYKLISFQLTKCKWFSTSVSIGWVYPGCKPLRPEFDPFKCWQPLSSKAAITGGNNSTAQRPTVLQRLCIPKWQQNSCYWGNYSLWTHHGSTLVQTVTLALPRAQSIFPKSELKTEMDWVMTAVFELHYFSFFTSDWTEHDNKDLRTNSVV